MFGGDLVWFFGGFLCGFFFFKQKRPPPNVVLKHFVVFLLKYLFFLSKNHFRSARFHFLGISDVMNSLVLQLSVGLWQNSKF